jgi:hypothetical protein
MHIVQEAGWAPETVWTQRLEEKSSASVGDRTPVADCVVRAVNIASYKHKFVSNWLTTVGEFIFGGNLQK